MKTATQRTIERSNILPVTLDSIPGELVSNDSRTVIGQFVGISLSGVLWVVWAKDGQINAKQFQAQSLLLAKVWRVATESGHSAPLNDADRHRLARLTHKPTGYSFEK